MTLVRRPQVGTQGLWLCEILWCGPTDLGRCSMMDPVQGMLC